MRRIRGFTLLEMMVSVALFAGGAVYVYSTISGVTHSSKSSTIQLDLGSQNKLAMTRLFSELQASSLLEQDTDGADATEPEAVFVIEEDAAAPKPSTKAKVVSRGSGGADVDGEGNWKLGAGKEQAREREITSSKRLRFRKVVGYQFSASSGAIVPEWSNWITYQLNDQNQLVRLVDGRPPRPVANRVDAFDVEAKVDGTVLVTVVTARQDPNNGSWRRYANAVTIHPKN